MKKTFIVLLILFSITVVSAQGVRFGAKGGLSLSDLELGGSIGSTDLLFDTKIRSFVYLGGLAEFSLSNSKSKIQVEVLYTENGAIVKEGEILGILIKETEIRVYQFLIPTIWKYKVYNKFSLYGGVYLGFNLDIKTENTTASNFKALDGGIIAGIEYDFTNRLFIEGRYNYGLVDIASGDESNSYFKNRFIQIGIGYKFN